MLSVALCALFAASIAMTDQAPTGYRNGDTMSGLDVLIESGFAPLKGMKIGLVTNHTCVSRDGKRGLDLMRQAGVEIGAIFSPEHGFLGNLDREGIGSFRDEETGIMVYSLYGETRRPTAEMMQGLDALVFDIMDVGVRFYTYETTMAYCLEEAAKAKIPYFVIDRPNPVTGTRVEGPPLDAARVSFVGYMAGTPARHGMTMGELARMFNGEKNLGADLRVIEMRDWQRSDWFDSTNQPWINPSPNMRSLKAAILYPGICLVEFPVNFSVGRGTDSPFEQIGADFVNGREFAAYLNARGIAGIRFYPTSFTPTESRFANRHIEGVRIEITEREAVDSVLLGLEVACALQKLYPGKIDWNRGRLLMGRDDVLRRIEAGEDPQTIVASYQDDLEAFKRIREKYLIYR
jgi:uncharacterized protein YbbC (DUF1343 family)